MVEVVRIKPEQVSWWMSFVDKGVREVCRLDDLHDPLQVLESLRTGQLMLWVVRTADSYKGFVITDVQQPKPGKAYLHIFMTYLDPSKQNGQDVLAKGLGQLEARAREHGAAGVTLLSSRRGFERRLKPMGYKPRLVEYHKEFDG
jgi:hypothetical protein